MLNNHDEEKYWVIIPAAGTGIRMENTVPKQYMIIQGKTILEHAVERFFGLPGLEKILVVIAPEDSIFQNTPLTKHPQIETVVGGELRCHCVMNALNQLKTRAKASDWVLVHDAARPCLSSKDLEALLQSLSKNPVGGLLGIPVSDTLKQCAEGSVVKTIDRQSLWRAQTPQMFRYQLLREALEAALQDKFYVTDEASAIEYSGKIPFMVRGSATNIKVTFPEDLFLIDKILDSSSY